MRIESLLVSVAFGLGMTLDLALILKRPSVAGQEIAENTPLGGLPLLRRLGSMSEERLSEIH